MTTTTKLFSSFLSPLLVLALAVLQADGSYAVGVDPAAELEARMFEALGGEERWAELESLFIQAVHHEERLDEPYSSRIWRDVGEPRFKILQITPDRVSVRVVNGDRGWVFREGEVEEMPEAQLEALRHWDAHVFYGTLHELARPGSSLRIEATGPRELTVFDGASLHAVLVLDDRDLPVRYGIPGRTDGELSWTSYTEWDTSAGYVHPVVSEVPSLGAVYRALSWVPSNEPLDLRFDREEALETGLAAEPTTVTEPGGVRGSGSPQGGG